MPWGFAEGIAAGLRLRYNHGSQYVSLPGREPLPPHRWLAGLRRRTGWERRLLLWVRRFRTFGELRLALLALRQTYSKSRIIERHDYRTTAQTRAGQATALPVAARAQSGGSELWAGLPPGLNLAGRPRRSRPRPRSARRTAPACPVRARGPHPGPSPSRRASSCGHVLDQGRHALAAVAGGVLDLRRRSRRATCPAQAISIGARCHSGWPGTPAGS